MLNWATDADGFVLEASETLGTAAKSRVSVETQVNGVEYSVHVLLGSRAWFYRLKREE